MNRALVWTVGGFVVLVAGLLVALWLGTAPRGGDAPSIAAAVVPTPPAPAPVLDPPFAPAAIPPGADGGSVATVRAPAAPGGGASNAPAAVAPDIALATAERKAEHDRVIQEHRKQVRERAKERHALHDRMRAEHQQRRLAREATRTPDPNRPPPERMALPRGSGIIPAHQATSPQ